MNRTDLVDAYYDWLIEKIELCDCDGASLIDIYSWSLKKLFTSEFKPNDKRHAETGSYDQDRACDGLYLREFFSEVIEVNEDFWRGLIFEECSILEMMIALAIRIDNNYLFDPDIGDRTSQWFWNMFESLGLMDYDNDNYIPEEVDQIIRTFNNGQYSSDGRGGLFSFEKADSDVKRYDIWSQMTRWINENFD